jgi:hypothetical protein
LGLEMVDGRFDDDYDSARVGVVWGKKMVMGF